MIERKITVASEHGLHARPAAIFVQAATEAGVPVTIAKGDKSVNAASILGVLSLGVSKGDEITLSVDGDEAVADQLVALLETNHDA